ncbi:MAG: YggS family pyridoxal phosphate-dependent enzyme [Planctomycetes bacterium]|nr:YggS family pyridoxal phosphate-dependent enzyme [Planctomycetota bacterium]
MAGNVETVRARIAAAARRAGRAPGDVSLVAITKSRGAEVFPALLAAGVADVGENRVIDAVEKALESPPGLRWHLVGHLQTNKVRKALGLFRTIHSVDSLRLARVINEESAPTGTERDRHAGDPVAAFIEIHSGESQKSGLPANELPEFLKAARTLDRIKWIGLMTMAPYAEDGEASRPHFRKLRELREFARGEISTIQGLSMGMTNDFEIAVEEGATHVRVGRALFAGLPG